MRPLSGCSKPAMIRSRVVLPDPDGPSRAVSSPSFRDRLTLSTATKSLNRLLTRSISILMGVSSLAVSRRVLALIQPLDKTLDGNGDQRQAGQQRRNRKRCREHVLVVEHLNVQRHGVGLPPNAAGYHRHRTELTQGPGITENHAVDQPPFDVGQGNVPEGFPATGAQGQRCLLFFLAL